jgi:Tfp pilus assembly protein PilO
MANKLSITQQLNQYLQTSEHRSYFVIAVTIAFVIAMVMFGILPAFSAFTEQGVENERRAEAIAELKTKRDALRNLTVESEEKKELIAYFNEVFPGEINQDDFILEIDKIAKASGIQLDSVGFETVQINDIFNNVQSTDQFVTLDVAVNAISVDLDATGSQQGINQFLTSLESKTRIVDIESLFISRKSVEEVAQITDGRIFDLSLRAYIFFFKPQSQAL